MRYDLEIQESYSISDDPYTVSYLRSLGRHPKVKACFDLVFAILSSYTSSEASQLLHEVRNESKFLTNAHVWHDFLLPTYNMGGVEWLFSPGSKGLTVNSLVS
ncbi:hypothetical protein BDW75DRAFT_235777 [Aspergillus navahoensis]